MQEFDIQSFFRLLRMNGYEVNPRYDKQNKLVGYTVGKNASVFKASEIGRRYMVSTIEATWRKLHPQPTQVKIKPSFPLITPATRSARPKVQTPVTAKPIVQPKSTNTVFSINTVQGIKEVTIPDTTTDIFINNVQAPEGNDTVTMENVSHVAMLLFANHIDAATAMSELCGGGGSSSSESGWGKKDDDYKFAHRCVQMAHSMYKPKPRYRFRR